MNFRDEMLEHGRAMYRLGFDKGLAIGVAIGAAIATTVGIIILSI